MLWSTVTAALAFGLSIFAPGAAAQKFVVKPLAEKKIEHLPAGPLYWRIETLPSMEQARAAEGPTSLVVQAEGKVWLVSLGTAGGATAGASRIAEIGPVPPISARDYLLRVNLGSGPPGARTPLHTHPGSESFYVLTGRLGQKTPEGEHHVDAGHTLTGKGADIPMEVFSAGTADVQALVMFIVDANRPFSSHVSIK